MSSSITTFIATALALFCLGQAVAESARQSAHPATVQGIELPWATR